MRTESKKAASERTGGKSVQTNAAASPQKQPTTPPDGTTCEIASRAVGTEATTTLSRPIPTTIDSTPSALVCTRTQQKATGGGSKEKALPSGAPAAGLGIWDIVPIEPTPNPGALSHLSFDDLLEVAKRAWKFGRMGHDYAVAAFQAIMDHYDGRRATHPPMKVEEAFASIGVNYEAARKLVYRDRKKRDLEAIAASLNLPPAPEVVTSIFQAGDSVTIADGKGVVQHVHQTTGKIDVVLDEGEATIKNVTPKNVTMLNGAAVIDGKVVKQKEHHLVAGELLIDATTRKRWTFADGKFSPSNMPTRKEVKQAAIDKLLAERAAALKRKEEEKKARKNEAARKELDKINAARAKREAAEAEREAERAKREAARLRKEEERNKRKAEAARKKAAKIEAAKARREARLALKMTPRKTSGTNVPRTFQWNLIQGSTDPKPYVVSNNKGETLSYHANETEAIAEVERLTVKYSALDIVAAKAGQVSQSAGTVR